MCVDVDGKEILIGLSFDVNVGEVYVVMGFNGLGKSIFFYVFLGCDGYDVIGGFIIYKGELFVDFDLEECVVLGIFLVF